MAVTKLTALFYNNLVITSPYSCLPPSLCLSTFYVMLVSLVPRVLFSGQCTLLTRSHPALTELSGTQGIQRCNLHPVPAACRISPIKHCQVAHTLKHIHHCHWWRFPMYINFIYPKTWCCQNIILLRYCNLTSFIGICMLHLIICDLFFGNIMYIWIFAHPRLTTYQLDWTRMLYKRK